MKCGILLRWSSLWIGAHWSPGNKRWCVNVVPFVTFWITLEGGRTPRDKDPVYTQVGQAYIAKQSKELYVVEQTHAHLPHVFPIYRKENPR